MGISLAWFKEIFKSEKEKELQKLQIDVKIKQLKEFAETGKTVIVPVEGKPFKKLKLVNNVLTIVLNDGSVLSKPNATIDDYKKARETKTEDQLLQIASSVEGLEERRIQLKEADKVKVLIKGIDVLGKAEDFIVKDNAVYLKGVKRSVPKLLIEKFAEIIGKGQDNMEAFDIDEYEALKKFWLKCCLNPNAQSAEDLYTFLQYHKFKIDKHGNFYAYRRVVSRNTTNKKLVEFVSNAYAKVKAVWKKKPADFFVYEADGDFAFSKDTHSTDLGNLQDLYLNLPSMQEKTYTSAHTGKEDYKVGSVISMPRNNGDDNNQVSCSKGFHAASKRYDYSGFGDTPILVIINPMDVLAVPKGEDGKLRTSRWFFAMTLDKEEQFILDDDDFDVAELGDVFEDQCLTNLEEHVKNGFAEEVQRHTFNLSNITSNEITGIVTKLEQMKDAISGRIAVVD